MSTTMTAAVPDSPGAAAPATYGELSIEAVRPPRWSRRSVLATLALPAVAGGAVGAAWAAEALAPAVGRVGSALSRGALTAARTDGVMLLGAAAAGQRLVAVGERGLVLTSEDAGATWQQRPTPVSVTLTAVRFADALRGVAVGHSGVVLLTQDGGQSWRLVLDGQRVAALALEAAQASPDAARLQEAQRLVADGADKPWLDVSIGGAGGQDLLVVGAYGLVLASGDGGKSWQPWMARLSNPKALHAYAVRRRGEVVLIAGEQGLVQRSDDGGRSFKRLETPYKGSFFTAELLADGAMVLAGLRGNALRSTDGGRSWNTLAVPMNASITASLLTPDGLLLANQAGVVLQLTQDRLMPLHTQPLPPINALVMATPANAGPQLLALTLQGTLPVPLSSSSATARPAAAPASAS